MARHELAAFGAAVRHYRARLSLTQEALADRSELHRTYVSGIERGVRNISLINIYRIAGALNVPVSELFDTAENFRRDRTRWSSRPRR